MALYSFLYLVVFLNFSQEAVAETPLRVAYAQEDYGNWHFCGVKRKHKDVCEKNDRVQGFNPDVAKELFRRIGRKFHAVFASWTGDQFLEGLNENKYDVIVSNVGKKKSREKYGIFSNLPYEPLDEKGDYFFYALKGEELSFKNIGVQTGSLQENFFRGVFQSSFIKSYQTANQLVSSLVSGRTKVIFGSFSKMKEQICGDSRITKFSTMPLSLDQGDVDDRTYVLTAKRRPQLAKEIDRALKSMHEDGTIKRLFDKWFVKKMECH